MVFAVVICIVFIIASRQKQNETIEIEKINDSLLLLQESLEAEILSKDEWKKLKKQRKKEEKIQDKAKDKPEKPRLYVIRFEGDIQASEVENLRHAVTALCTVLAPTDEVLLVLDSAGGFVHHYGLAASQLQRLKERGNYLTVAVDLVAASGGYLMASVANHIIAAPFAVIGSVGVLGQVPNFHRLLEKNNIDVEQHTAGEYKRTLTLFGKNTDKAREKFKDELEETHLLFKQFVFEHRPILDIEKIATGEHWYGKKALDLKLIDAIQTSDDYLLSKRNSHDIYEIKYEIEKTLGDKIKDALHGALMRVLSSLSSRFGVC